MTAKEKANELVQSFYNNQSSHSITSVAFNSAKRCALICVDEMYKTIEHFYGQDKEVSEYIEDVKQEINKI